MRHFKAATAAIKRRLRDRVLTSDDALFRASFDGSKLSFLPEAVIVPKKDADIQAKLEVANRFKVPVTVRGGGTSLNGSGSPLRGGWVIDISGWNGVEIDEEGGFAEVQYGAN